MARFWARMVGEMLCSGNYVEPFHAHVSPEIEATNNETISEMKKSPIKPAAAKSLAKPATKAVAKESPNAASDTSPISITSIGPVNPTTHAPQSSFAVGTIWAVDVSFASTEALKKVTFAFAIEGAFSLQVDGKVKNVVVGANDLTLSNTVPSDAKTKNAKVTINLLVNGKKEAAGKTSFTVTS